MVSLEAPTDVPAGTSVAVTALVTDATGAPIAGAAIVLTQVQPDGSSVQHPATTDAAGRASWTPAFSAGLHTVSATTTGGSSAPVTVTAHRAAVTVEVAVAPAASAQPGREVTMTVVRTPYREAPMAFAGAPVTWERLSVDGWEPVGSATADARGVVATRLRPRALPGAGG